MLKINIKGILMNFISKYMVVIVTMLMGIVAFGLPLSSAYSAEAEPEGDFKLTYEKLCGSDIACTTFNYCTGCHRGLVVGTTVIDQGRMRPPPGNYDDWVSRLKRMSIMGCHIPAVLIPPMASYLDGLDNAPLSAKAKARMKAEAAAKEKEAARNPGKSNVETYCIGCHDGLVVGKTVIGAGHLKSKPRTYEEWVSVIQKMSERPPTPASRVNAGAHIPPALIPAMAAYLDSLDNGVIQ